MRRVRFPPKAVTVYSGKKVGFDCKNNYGPSKSANFRLDTISSINCRTSHVLYLIRVGVEKCPTGPKKLRVICLIALAM